MINPGKYNITAYQGATYSLSLNWQIGGTAVDLSGYTAAMQVRSSVTAPDTILDLDTGTEITLGGTAGTISITVPASTMGSAIPGKYLYDLELDSGSTVTRLLEGAFQILPEVTK
jgi:hypothetical protein